MKSKLPPFDGADYTPKRDDPRLGAQYLRIFNLMSDQQWRTLPEMSAKTGDPPASISAQLRHMRKERFGAHTINRRYLDAGLYEYQLIPSREPASEPGEQLSFNLD